MELVQLEQAGFEVLFEGGEGGGAVRRRIWLEMHTHGPYVVPGFFDVFLEIL